jgi:hypothetical protein
MIDDQELVHRLLDAGVADKDTLRKGIALRNESGSSLYETLIVNRLVSQRATVRLLGKLLSVPTIQLDAINPSDRVTALVPASMARRNRSIPLGLREKDGRRFLLVAMYDPTDVLAVGEVSTHTGYDVRPVLVGPRDLADAMERHYGLKDALSDDIFGDISGLDFASSTIGAQDKPDKEWSEFFDKPDEVGAESSDISLEMRDRPSTDVLDIPEEEVDAVLAEGEDPMVAFEIVETGRHPAVPMADLKKYDVDEAITGNTGVRDDTGNHSDSGSYAQILSANAAEALFTDGPQDRRTDSASANLGRHVSGSGPYRAAELLEDSEESEEFEDSEESEEFDEEDTGNTSGNASGTSVGMRLDELSDLVDPSEPSEVSDGTAIGHGVRESLAEHDDTNSLEDDSLDNTGRTQFGMAPADERDAGMGAAFQGMTGGKRNRADRSATDYRALGAQILKEESEAEVEETARTDAEQAALEDAKTGIRQRLANKLSRERDEPATREVDEAHLRDLAGDTDNTNVRVSGAQRANNPFAHNEPTVVHERSAQRDDGSFRLPDDVPIRELLEAMIESMAELGLAEGNELVRRARELASQRNKY